ncbi:curli assembly protein CsgF [Noviherbaspirillum autotrophicum]|uniref:curli assembly protein CsgF n=1 Tax=Noviherbaspirillum autotrophicum TaxID=709839 RepID=UPI001E41AE59|nr:curli assembly protein CsgF [Noviherbaspirillum autotrophicum]
MNLAKTRFRNVLIAAATAASTMELSPAGATELVYVPVNPAFGGSPLNGSVLLNSAQAQNRHKDPDDPSSLFGNKTPLEQFNESLQRRVLDDLSTAASKNLISADGKFIPGTFQSGDFRIAITNLGNGMVQITTTDLKTGATTSFQVSQSQ